MWSHPLMCVTISSVQEPRSVIIAARFFDGLLQSTHYQRRYGGRELAVLIGTHQIQVGRNHQKFSIGQDQDLRHQQFEDYNK